MNRAPRQRTQAGRKHVIKLTVRTLFWLVLVAILLYWSVDRDSELWRLLMNWLNPRQD